MKIEVIEGVRMGHGDTLVIVPGRPFERIETAQLSEYAQSHGIKVMVLPPNSKVYIKEAEPRLPKVAVRTLDGDYALGYQPTGDMGNPTPPGAD